MKYYDAQRCGAEKQQTRFPAMLCPHCSGFSTFKPIHESLPEIVILTDSVPTHRAHVCLRICSNPRCNGFTIVVADGNGAILEVMPPQRSPFDKTNIPQAIVTNFEEANTCYANGCFTAAAIMLRKTMEIVCDENGASGSKLYERIKSLKSKVVLPDTLFAATDNLRLLGNDAAHIELKDYNVIDRETLDIAFEFMREILRGLYQYDHLLKRLQDKQKGATPVAASAKTTPARAGTIKPPAANSPGMVSN